MEEGLREESPSPVLRLREMAGTERPQERLQRLGAGALSDAELLAMLLRSGSATCDVLTLSNLLIRRAGSLQALLTWSARDFEAVHGIGRVKALQLLAVMEIARRVLAQDIQAPPLLDTPDKVHAYLHPLLAGVQVERFYVLCLNRKNRLIRAEAVTSGTANASLVHPREVFRLVIREGSSAAICAHNHPSGDPAPSQADIQVTRQLRDAAKTLHIDLLDHVVIGQRGRDPLGQGWYSFADSGLL